MKRLFLLLVIALFGMSLFGQNAYNFPVYARGGIQIGWRTFMVDSVYMSGDTLIVYTTDQALNHKVFKFLSLEDGGVAAWGSISGTLSNQTDLQSALDAKAPLSHTHTASDITDFSSAVSLNADVAANTAHRNITSGNPHNVTKGDVGLGNVDNTSDADKPISTATQDALDLKAPIASPVFTGTPYVPGYVSTAWFGPDSITDDGTNAYAFKDGDTLTPYIPSSGSQQIHDVALFWTDTTGAAGDVIATKNYVDTHSGGTGDLSQSDSTTIFVTPTQLHDTTADAPNHYYKFINGLVVGAVSDTIKEIVEGTDTLFVELNNGNIYYMPKYNGSAPSNSAPTATNVTFTGTLTVGETQTGSYVYNDADGDAEGTSSFQWYRADDGSGTNQATISGATNQTYVLQDVDSAKYIAFEVTPVAATGTSPGSAVMSSWRGAVSDTGATSYSDDFEARSTGALAGQGDWVVGMNNIDVVDDAGNNVLQGDTASQMNIAIYNKTFSDDQYSQCVLHANGSSYFLLAVRLTGSETTLDGYAVLGKDGETAFYRIDNGAATKIGSWDFTTNYSTGDTLKLNIVGTALHFYINGTESANLASTTDATYSSGQAGIGIDGNSATTQLDSWEGGDL